MKHIAVVILSFAFACGGSEKSADEPTGSGDDRVELGDERSGTRRSAVPSIDDDDDDDDGMEVQGIRGRIAPGEVDRTFRANVRDMHTCFAKVSKRKKWLGGSVKFDFLIEKGTGAVKKVAIIEADLGNWEVESCLLGVASAMQFSKPKGNGDAEAGQSIAFDARRPPQDLTEDETDQQVADKLETLAACEDAPDDVWVVLYIGKRGKVLSSGFATPGKQVLSETWATCATDVIAGWTLADPRGKVAKGFFRYNP